MATRKMVNHAGRGGQTKSGSGRVAFRKRFSGTAGAASFSRRTGRTKKGAAGYQ